MNLALHITKAEARLQEIEVELSLFDFKAPGSDGRRYQTLHREHQRLSRIRNLWRTLQAAEKQMQDNRDLLASETDPEFLAVVRHDLQELELRLPVLDRELKALILPPRPNEDRDVIVEIRPAAGGDEAGLFASELFRMYTRYAEARGWRLELLELSESDLGGIKDVAFSLRGDDVFARLCYESGVHRVQRVPVTEAGGRIHTSTVTVAMLPEAQEVDVVIDPEDLRIDTFRASGNGGQNVNRTDSAVRVTHLPTGIFFACQQEKSQHRNREIAMRLLRSRLLQIKQDEENAKYAAERRQQVGTGERSERIRTYNFPQNRVTDHRYELTRYDLPEIISGERFGELVESIVAKDVERRLTEELR